MTNIPLRDYIAIKAMKELMKSGERDPKSIATTAYRIADAMMAETGTQAGAPISPGGHGGGR